MDIYQRTIVNIIILCTVTVYTTTTQIVKFERTKIRLLNKLFKHVFKEDIVRFLFYIIILSKYSYLKFYEKILIKQKKKQI